MRKGLIVVAFAAGWLGGVASHYVWPRPVLAESSPVEIRARRFVLVNDRGAVIGTFAEEANGPALKLYDKQGRETWVAGTATGEKAAGRSFAAVGR